MAKKAEPKKKAETKKRRSPRTTSRSAATTANAPGVVQGISNIAPDDKNIVIRMYNIGFGDCFLLQIPTEVGLKRVLIDCGVHASGHNPQTTVNEIIAQVHTDISDVDGKKRIDLVIATHRHQDHVSGFADDRWSEVEVGEVWLPWTENYKDPKAVEILKKQSMAGKKLAAALQLMIANPQRFGFSAAKVTDLKALKDFSENSLSNREAMQTLHGGFKGGNKIKRQYLPFEDRSKNSLEPNLLPGVKVHLMGPSRDPEVIRDMDPATNQEWLAFIEQKTADSSELLPFHESWGVAAPSDDVLKTYIDIFDKPAAQMTATDRTNGSKALKGLRSILKRVSDAAEGTEFGVAVSLDKAVNGTSLMIMFEVGKAHLLFPGDAQNGTWQWALKDDEWRSLLTKTNFYKVGHHGSHNATPKEFVHEILQPKFRAMTPVYPVKKWKYIPKTELIDALRERQGEIVRSDKPFDGFPDPASFTRTRLYVETKIRI